MRFCRQTHLRVRFKRRLESLVFWEKATVVRACLHFVGVSALVGLVTLNYVVVGTLSVSGGNS